MMTALATVTDVQTLSEGYQVDLSCEQKTSCSGCASAKSCATGTVSGAIGNKSLQWKLNTSTSVSQGQVVEIGFPERSLLESAALVYLLPLFALLLGATLGDTWLAPLLKSGEGVVVLTAFIFTALGIVMAKWLAKRLELRTKDEVVILRILGEPITSQLSS
jgi:sigma-E factor negative regulatory protein RseC